MKGAELVEACKEHVLETMRHLSECQPAGEGLGNRAIETEAGFELELERQDGWFTWSLLFSLVKDGRVEVVEAKRGRRFRLSATPSE